MKGGSKRGDVSWSLGFGQGCATREEEFMNGIEVLWEIRNGFEVKTKTPA